MLGLLALALPAAARGSDRPEAERHRALLERHRPVLRYDADERDFATSVAALSASARLDRVHGAPLATPTARFLGAYYGDGRPAAAADRLAKIRDPRGGRPLTYGRAARDGARRLWLQYWLFLADNTQDWGILQTGRHTGDWEMLQVRIDGHGRPVEVVFAQHTWAATCEWSEIERDATAPVAYVANGSHALYPRRGTHDRPFPDPNDEADGRGRRIRPPVEVVTGDTPRWMAWPGRWGESEAGSVPGEQPSPRGPAFQPERWSDPGRFAADEARPCHARPPGRPWQTAITLALAGLLLAAALRAAQRRR